MPLEFSCASCNRQLRVGQEHAGKTIRCPACGQISTAPIPGSPNIPSAVDIAGKDSSPQWFMRSPDGREFGPISRAELDRWVRERRVFVGCLVRDENANLWTPAETLYPQLAHGEKPSLSPSSLPPMSVSGYSSGGYGSSPSPMPGVSASGVYLTPHRGALILILGILGLATNCVLLSFFAWVMGGNDLREMREGRMDRSGEAITRVGYYLGMIISVLTILGIFAILGILMTVAIFGN